MAAFWLRVRIRLAPILRSSRIVWSHGSGCAERVFLAQRAPYPDDGKTWRTITYGDFRTRIRRIGIFGL